MMNQKKLRRGQQKDDPEQRRHIYKSTVYEPDDKIELEKYWISL